MKVEFIVHRNDKAISDVDEGSVYVKAERRALTDDVMLTIGKGMWQRSLPKSIYNIYKRM